MNRASLRVFAYGLAILAAVLAADAAAGPSEQGLIHRKAPVPPKKAKEDAPPPDPAPEALEPAPPADPALEALDPEALDPEAALEALDPEAPAIDVSPAAAAPGWKTYGISSSSYIGGSASTDDVRGAAIQSNGTVVLAANVTDSAWGGVTPTLLNGATASSPGTIVRLSPDGATVLSVTRVADRVLDLAIDAADNLYVALWTQGFIKINSSATAVVWVKTYSGSNVWRVDAGPAGYCVAKTHPNTQTDPGSSTPGGGTLYVYDPAGAQLGSFAGHRHTLDVCIAEATQTVCHVGWRQATAWDGSSYQPVQISYIRGQSYTGDVKYTGYDWSTDPASPDFLNRPTNNMADTRGYRCAIGADGKFYAAFECAGGNHIFRYDPFNIMLPVTIVGGDRWHQFYNTKSEHKTFFARYEPATGAYYLGQQFLCRLSDNRGNTARVAEGSIAADALGRVYIGGTSAYGLPLPPHVYYSDSPDRAAFNAHGTYVGGAWFLVMSPDFVTRLYCSRQTAGYMHAAAARILSGTTARVVYAGKSTGELYTRSAIQASLQGTQDGWFTVIPSSEGDPANRAPTADFTATPTFGKPAPLTVTFNASASSDPDGDPLLYVWHFGDGTKATGATVQRAYLANGDYHAVLTVDDGRGGWDQERTNIHVGNSPPVAAFTANPTDGLVPLTVTFDASASTDPDNDPLAYFWNFGDGQQASGVIVQHTYTAGGNFTVTLTVDDGDGGTNATQKVIAAYAMRDPDNPLGAVNGLDYAYYEGTWDKIPDFSSLVPVKTGVVSTFDISVRNQNDYFGFRYTGYVEAPSDGLYTFYTSSDDGSRLYIGTTMVVDNDGTHGTTEKSGKAALKAGKHAIRVDYFEKTGGQALTVSWAGPGISKQAIPASRLFRVPPNNPPVAVFTAVPASGEAPLTVTFNASASADPDGDPLAYDWNFGDGQFGSGVITQHTYATAGQYTATLTVSDGRGGIDSDQKTITVTPPNTPPVVTITAPEHGTIVGLGSAVLIAAEAHDPDPDGGIERVEFWEMGAGVKLGESAAAPYEHTFAPGSVGVLTLVARAYDNRGAAADSVPVQVEVRVPGDADGDAKVDEADLAILRANWHRTGATWLDGDFNGDGIVDSLDVAILRANWGSGGQQ